MKKLVLYALFTCSALTAAAQAPDSWTQKANVGTTGRSAAVGFSIGGKGYIGTGTDGSTNYRTDFWEFDPATNTWAQKANFGGVGRSGAAGFSIGQKGYIGTGTTAGGYVNDFWEYDPATNAWTQKASFGGTPRQYAAGLSIGPKGYIGTGQDDFSTFLNDFWEYDPTANAWTQKANLAGPARFYPAAFTIGQKGYVGLGFGATNPSDLWEYDPTANSWTQKASFTGTPRAGVVSFGIGQKGYVATGHNGTTWVNEMWEYDLTANNWTQRASLPGMPRAGGSGFSIGQKGYAGTGYTGTIWAADFWEYTPVALPVVTTAALASSAYCQGAALNVDFTTSFTYSAGNVFTAELSDATGSFAAPVAIGTLTGTGSGTIAATIPTATPAGTQYRIRVTASNPATTGSDNGTDITIDAMPAVSISGLPPAVCVSGTPLSLTGNLGGSNFTGAGISGNTFDPGVAGAGVHVVTYTATQGSCTSTVSQQVTVGTPPTVSTTVLPATICSNDLPTALTGSPAGGTFSGPGIVSGNSFDPAAAGAGTHTLTYTVTQSGCTETSSQQVTVTQAPVAAMSGLAAAMCSNAAAVTITGTPAGGTFSGPGISGSQFDPAAAGAGTHTVSYAVTAGGCTNTTTQQVVVNEAPSAVFSFTSNFQEFSFSSSAPAATYSWNFGDGSTSALQNPVHTFADAGNFTVTLTTTNAAGCTATTTQQVTSLINGTGNAAAGLIGLYPNPAGTFIRIDTGAGLSDLVFELYSLTGQRVLEARLTGQATQIDVSTLAEGAYVARLSSGSLNLMQRVVISR